MKEYHPAFPGNGARVVVDGYPYPFEKGYLVQLDGLEGKGPWITRGGKRLHVSMNEVRPAYQVRNGTYYDARTLPQVVEILERARASGERVRLHYGDTDTGRDWLEENDVTGRISRSTGDVKIPLIIYPSGSYVGPGILDGDIVKIRTASGNLALWAHPKYYHEEVRYCDGGGEYPFGVTVGGKRHSNFKTAEKRYKWLLKMGLFVTM